MQVPRPEATLTGPVRSAGVAPSPARHAGLPRGGVGGASLLGGKVLPSAALLWPRSRWPGWGTLARGSHRLSRRGRLASPLQSPSSRLWRLPEAPADSALLSPPGPWRCVRTQAGPLLLPRADPPPPTPTPGDPQGLHELHLLQEALSGHPCAWACPDVGAGFLPGPLPGARQRAVGCPPMDSPVSLDHTCQSHANCPGGTLCFDRSVFLWAFLGKSEVPPNVGVAAPRGSVLSPGT